MVWIWEKKILVAKSWSAYLQLKCRAFKLRDTIDEGKDSKTVRILLRRSPLKKNLQTNSSGVGMACVGGLENFCFKMLELT